MKERILSTIGSKQTMWMPMILFAASFVFYLWLVWERVPGILGDQGWFLQVSRRVAAGEILYRDVLWSYGPLPVYLMSWLMQHANYDIAFHAIFHTAIAASATLVIYRLHRFSLSPIHSALGAVLIMVLGGTFIPFLLNYTAAGALGALCMLVTLLGLVGCLRNQKPRHYTLMTTVGLAGALLSKQEFAFGALTLGVFVFAVVRFTRPIDEERRPFARVILFSWVTGILIAVIFYGILSRAAGWQPILEGITGYQIFQVARTTLVAYSRTSSWVYILTASVSTLIIAMGLGASLRFADLTQKKLVLRICAIILFAYYIFLLAWRTGWLSDVRHQKISVLDLPLFSRIDLTDRVLVWFFQVHLAKILWLGIVILLVVITPRWIRRIRQKEPVNFEQIACLTALVFALLVDLRFALFATNFLPPTTLVWILSMLSSELPQIKTLLKPSLGGKITIAVGFIFIFSVNTFPIALSYSHFTLPFSSAYGQVRLDPIMYPLVDESVQYIKSNSQPEDYIAVIGPLPGIYYLGERKNPFRQDYLSVFVGNSENDAPDYLERMNRFAPPILLVPQADQNYGILNLRGSSDDAGTVRAVGRRLFGAAAPQVEAYLQEHYQFDRFLNENHVIEFAAFKRVK
jgi:hypothetical protein